MNSSLGVSTLVAFKCFRIVVRRCLGPPVGYSLWTLLEILPNDLPPEMATDEKVIHTTSSLGDVLSKELGRRRVHCALRRVDWSLLISLGGLTKSWFQTNHGCIGNIRVHAHRRLCKRGVWLHPKGIWTEQSVTVFHWPTWPSGRPVG